MMVTGKQMNNFDLFKICENPLYVDDLLSSLTNQEQKELEKLYLLLNKASYEEIENVLCKVDEILKKDVSIVEQNDVKDVVIVPPVKRQNDIFLHPLFQAMW